MILATQMIDQKRDHVGIEIEEKNDVSLILIIFILTLFDVITGKINFKKQKLTPKFQHIPVSVVAVAVEVSKIKSLVIFSFFPF